MPFVNGKYVAKLGDPGEGAPNNTSPTHRDPAPGTPPPASPFMHGNDMGGGAVDFNSQGGAGQGPAGPPVITRDTTGMRREVNGPADNSIVHDPGGFGSLLPKVPTQPKPVDPYEEDSKRQMALIQQLMDQAQGKGSVQGMQQLQNSYRDAASQQLSAAMSGRGNLAGAQGRMGQQGAQNVLRHQAGSQQMLKLQSQLNARNMLGQLLAQAQGQDLGQAGISAQKLLGDRSLEDTAWQNMLGNQFRQSVGGVDAQMGYNNIGLGVNPYPYNPPPPNYNPIIGGGANVIGAGANKYANATNTSTSSNQNTNYGELPTFNGNTPGEG